jgi:hypothetical protein
VEERPLRFGSLVEWFIAALGVAALGWVISVPIAWLTGPRVEASLTDSYDGRPPGVPSAATSVPVMLLMDGRAIRLGDVESRLRQILPDRLVEGPPHLTNGEFGDRQTRTYRVDGIRLQIVLERTERGGPPRIAAIFVN